MIDTMKKGFIASALFFIAAAIPMIGYANPDPDYIKISNQGNKVKLIPHGFDSNIPSQDTANLKWVFDNYSKSDIHLESGTFHISETIEVAGYQGQIKGDGKDSTFIVGRGPLVNGEYQFPGLNADLTERFYPAGVAGLFWFHTVEGNVNDWQANKLAVELKDFTIRVDGVGPELAYYEQPVRTLWTLIHFTGDNALFTDQVGNVPHIELNVKNVNFIAQEVPYVLNGVNRSNTNAAAAMIVYGGENWYQAPGLNGWNELDHSPVNAQVEVKSSYFEGFHQFAIAIEGLFTSNTGTSYTFPTNPVFPQASAKIKNNSFKNVGNGAGVAGSLGFNLLFLAISETEVEVKENHFEDLRAGGVVFINNVAEALPKITSNFTIKDNEFEHIPTNISAASIALLDFGFFNGPYYKLDIKDNKFSAGQGFNASFVEIGMGTGALIKDNDFKGTATAAISIGNTHSPIPPNDVLPATSCHVSENDFHQLTASVANIVLGQGSVLNTVRVEHASDVQDSGQFNTIKID